MESPPPPQADIASQLSPEATGIGRLLGSVDVADVAGVSDVGDESDVAGTSDASGSLEPYAQSPIGLFRNYTILEDFGVIKYGGLTALFRLLEMKERIALN